VLRENAGSLVPELDRDVQHRIAGVSEITKAAEHLGGDEQALRGTEMRGIEIPVDADDGDAGFHREVERTRVAVRLLEQVLDRDRQLPREVTEAVSQCFDDVVSQGVAFHALDALAKSFRRVVEAVKNHFLQSESSQLSYGVELWRVERDVRDEWERRVALKETGDGTNIHDPVGCRIQDYDTDRLAADERFELLPGFGNEKLRLISKNVLDVGEEPGGQERRNAQVATARMI